MGVSTGLSVWERAIGMRGYRGSPAERADRAEGITVGGQVRWLATSAVESQHMVGTITKVEIDADGDPWFHLTFGDDDHKDVRVERSEIAPAEAS